MPISRRYGVADTIYFPMITRGAVDFATSSVWTPVQSDCRIQIDTASASYATNVVTATGSRWTLSMTAAELSGKKIGVYIVDAATKAVEDQDIEIETYGSPLAQQGFDYTVATISLSQPAADQVVNAVWATGSRTLSSFGTLQGDVVNAVWATPSRTLSALDDKVIATSAVYKIAAGVWATPSTGTARTDIVNEVWATPSRTLTSLGSAQDGIVNAVWATPTRTLSALDDKVIATSAVYKLAAGVWATPSAGQAVNQLADVVLRRSYTTAHATTSGDALTGRSLLGAVAKLVNLVQVNGANLEVMHEDDSTVFITQAITTDSAAAPITKLDTQ